MNYGAWDWWWNSEEWKADIGYSADKSIYDSLEPEMLKAPTTEAQAYDQAAYFIAIAARRADYEGEKEAQDKLWAYLNVVREGKVAEVGQLCGLAQFTGVGESLACKWGGKIGILKGAIDSIKDSGLNEWDSEKLIGLIRDNKKVLARKALVPKLIAVGAGVGLILYFATRTSRTKKLLTAITAMQERQ